MVAILEIALSNCCDYGSCAHDNGHCNSISGSIVQLGVEARGIWKTRLLCLIFPKRDLYHIGIDNRLLNLNTNRLD